MARRVRRSRSPFGELARIGEKLRQRQGELSLCLGREAVAVRAGILGALDELAVGPLAFGILGHAAASCSSSSASAASALR